MLERLQYLGFAHNARRVMLGATLCLQAAVDDSLFAFNLGFAMTLRCSFALLFTLSLCPLTAHATGMLQPGWAPIAEPALVEIRAAVLRAQPATAKAGYTASQPGSAQPVIDAFIAAPGSATPADAANARLDQLLASFGLAAGNHAGASGNGADRVAQAFSLGNATSQLAESVYGGAPGGAAYAAWWAYRQPGATPAQAVAVGWLAGTGIWAAQNDANGLGVTSQVSQRTSLAAALGGVAVAAAGGDDNALRGLFFETGAAVLVQDGSQVHCLSATGQCKAPPVKTAKREAAVPNLPKAIGALPVNGQWALAWQWTQPPAPGLFYPAVALTQATAPAAPDTAPLPQAQIAQATPTTGTRYACSKGADTRTIWIEPGEPGTASVCKTLYQVDQTRAVLWNAKQHAQVCQAKAQAQVDREKARGYRCGVVGS